MLEEIESLSLPPDAHTQRIIELGEGYLSRMRTFELKKRLTRGAHDEDSRIAAWELFCGLCERGQADVYQIRAMRSAARQMRLELRSSKAAGGATGDGDARERDRRYLDVWFDAFEADERSREADEASATRPLEGRRRAA